MKVILLESIGGLGKLAESVEVKPGYGRNYLLPQAKAVVSTPDNIKYFEDRKEELESAEKDRVAIAKKRAEKLSALQLTISARVSGEGKLYGSVGASEIVDAIKEAGEEAYRQEVQLPDGPFRTLGDDFEVQLYLHHGEVVATVKLKIIAEA